MMTKGTGKATQKLINAEAEAMYERATEEWYTTDDEIIERLRTCTAWVIETKNWYILRSYNTIIGCINKETKIGYDLLRYVYGFTSTSSQHMAKFLSDYGDRRKVYTWRSAD